MSSELLPCPFCGNKAIKLGNCSELDECTYSEECPAEEPYVCVLCSFKDGGCGTTSGYFNSIDKATTAWNRRTDKPTADAKEVVPCGQCKSCVAGEAVYDMFCVELERNCYTIGYCGLGERKVVE